MGHESDLVKEGEIGWEPRNSHAFDVRWKNISKRGDYVYETLLLSQVKSGHIIDQWIDPAA